MADSSSVSVNIVTDAVDASGATVISAVQSNNVESSVVTANVVVGAKGDTVTSVAGKIGAVTLDKADVGLSNVDNTSDADKPVSTATQTALSGKVDKTGDVMTGSLTAKTLTAGTETDVLGTALSVIRNNVAVGRIDNNASGLRVQAQNGSLQLRGTGNTGIAIDALGNAVVAGTITGANLSGTNTGDQPLGSRTITGTTNQITVTNGDGVSGNPTLSLPSAITTPGSLTITGNNSPQADSTYTLGTSSLYWSNTYTDRLYLNATAYADGATAGQFNIVATNLAINGSAGATGSFTTADSKTVTVTKGLITSIV